MTPEEHKAFIARTQAQVDAIYARHHGVRTVVGPPDQPNGPNNSRYATCGNCGDPVVPNGRGGWRHKR